MLFLFRHPFLGVSDSFDTVAGRTGRDQTSQRVPDRLKPVVAVDAQEVGARQQALDVLVVGVEDHEDWRHVVLHVFEHGHRHAFIQVVTAERYDVEVGLGLFFLLLTFFNHRHVTLQMSRH